MCLDFAAALMYDSSLIGHQQKGQAYMESKAHVADILAVCYALTSPHRCNNAACAVISWQSCVAGCR